MLLDSIHVNDMEDFVNTNPKYLNSYCCHDGATRAKVWTERAQTRDAYYF